MRASLADLLILALGGAAAVGEGDDVVDATSRRVNPKRLEWYTERCGGQGNDNQSTCADALRFATVSHGELVDGVMPCCSLLQIDCATGLLEHNVSEYDFSAYAPFLAAGKTVRVTLQGAAAPVGGAPPGCCVSAEDCRMFESREQLAQQLLEVALKYNLTGFTGDWEWDSSGPHPPKGFHWPGWNMTMAHIASVLSPHGVGLGNGIVANCEGTDLCALDGGGISDPCCCPAYRDTPWADVLTDMGSYSILSNQPSWSKCPPDAERANSPITPYCGWEGGILNVLHSPVATVYPDRAPQLSPALWLGDCFPNGTGTKQGWTQPKLSSFLSFLDTQGITRIGVWCMTNESDPIGFPCPVDPCPWMYDELLKWKRRPAKTDDGRFVAVEADGGDHEPPSLEP